MPSTTERKTDFEVIELTPWGLTAYEQALAFQAKLAKEGRAGWILFCCPPTVTCGRRSAARDVLLTSIELQRLGVRHLEVDRGGQVTYHGPGQIIGFPFGTLKRFMHDSRAVRPFVERLRLLLESVVSDYKKIDHEGGRQAGQAGVWVFDDQSCSRKIVAMGLGFGREGMRHGFAMNVEPAAFLRSGFNLINPCGEPGANPETLFDDVGGSETAFSRLKADLARRLSEWDVLSARTSC